MAQRGTRCAFAISTRGRLVVGPEDADRLAALHQQRLVVPQPAERLHDLLVAGPVPRRLPASAVHDELLGPLGDGGVEVVHQHPEGGLLVPPAAGERGTGGRGDRRGVRGWRSWNGRLKVPEPYRSGARAPRARTFLRTRSLSISSEGDEPCGCAPCCLPIARGCSPRVAGRARSARRSGRAIRR